MTDSEIRDEFERWARDVRLPLSRDSIGMYDSLTTHMAWCAVLMITDRVRVEGGER